MEIFIDENQDELPLTVNIESVECSPELRDAIEDNKNSVISKNLPGTNQQSRNFSLNRTRTNIKVVTGSEFLESKGPVTNATMDLKPRKVSFQAALSVEDQALQQLNKDLPPPHGLEIPDSKKQNTPKLQRPNFEDTSDSGVEEKLPGDELASLTYKKHSSLERLPAYSLPTNELATKKILDRKKHKYLFRNSIQDGSSLRDSEWQQTQQD